MTFGYDIEEKKAPTLELNGRLPTEIEEDLDRDDEN